MKHVYRELYGENLYNKSINLPCPCPSIFQSDAYNGLVTKAP